MRTLSAAALAASIFAASVVNAPVQTAAADELAISLADLKGSLESLKGKEVTLQLSSGQEIAGKLSEISGTCARLASLKGKEFFDAVVPLDKITAVIVRAR